MQSRFQEGPRSGVLAKPKHTLLVCETCNNCTMQTTNAGQGNKTLPLELRHQGVITCIVEHPVGFEGQPPTDAAPSFAPPHAADCRSPAAGTSEVSPVQADIHTHILTDILKLYMDAQHQTSQKGEDSLCMHIAHNRLRTTIIAKQHH